MDSRFVRKIKRGLVNFKDNVKANVQDNAMTLLYIIVIAGILIFIIAYLGGFIPNIGKVDENKKELGGNGNPVLNNSVIGRYIRLERNDNLDKEIQLADIKIYRLSKPGEQLSSLSSFELSRLSDSDTTNIKNGIATLVPMEAKNISINPQHSSGAFGAENLFDNQDMTLTMTSPSKNAYIEIDLGENKDIRGIELKNRKDCCQEKLAGVVVKVISEDKKSVLSYKIDRATDRYIIIERDFVAE